MLKYDVSAIGVGGLAAAKTYLELNPDADILLLEKVKSKSFINFAICVC